MKLLLITNKMIKKRRSACFASDSELTVVDQMKRKYPHEANKWNQPEPALEVEFL